MPQFDAVLVLSFGGPEQREDVIPFLENVLRGRNVPRERMLEVAEHYYHFGGRSPINDQNRALIDALRHELSEAGVALPVYWGNRNWHPYLRATLREMQADGIGNALVFITSAFGSYSGCRQYLEDIDAARSATGGPAPKLTKLPAFYNHPGFITAVADGIRRSLEEIDPDRRAAAGLLFTAHSIPVSMAASSPYLEQLNEACALVARELNSSDWRLVYQSRSGPPTQPWLEPDILDALRRYRDRHSDGAPVVVSPIGFISDHMEVLYDLDTEAAALAKELGLDMHRAATPGVHPAFVRMIAAMVADCVAGRVAPLACAADCCPPPRRPTQAR